MRNVSVESLKELNATEYSEVRTKEKRTKYELFVVFRLLMAELQVSFIGVTIWFFLRIILRLVVVSKCNSLCRKIPRS